MACKIIITLFCFIASLQTAFAQNPKTACSIIAVEEVNDIKIKIDICYVIMYISNELS